MVDLEFEGSNSPIAFHKIERLVTFGHIPNLEVRGQKYTNPYLEEKLNDYCIERVFISTKDRIDVEGTYIDKTIKDLEYGGAKYDINDLDVFIRGLHKLDRKLKWDGDNQISVNYNKNCRQDL